MHCIVVFDIDGVVRDVGNSYRRALADTVEYYTQRAYRPTMADVDELKAEGIWNNDWQASQELVYRYFEKQGKPRTSLNLDYKALVDFFQSRYRGTDPVNWNGYITTEPLLISKEYLASLTAQKIAWGFFSGATRGSAEFILKKRLGLNNPVLVAMEDAPGKPDPTGLFASVTQLEGNTESLTPVIYVGDTVADIYTITKARELQPERPWLAVGVLPPHVQSHNPSQANYTKKLKDAGADKVLDHVEKLTPSQIKSLL